MRVIVAGALCALFLVPIAAGCALSGGTDRVELLDPELRGTLVLKEQRPRYNDAGQLLAEAEIRNRAPDTELIMIRTVFFDVEDRPVEVDVPWENRTIPGYGSIYYRRTSLGEGAIDFRIEIRRGKSQ